MRGLRPLASDRLVLRPMAEGDAAFVVGLRSDPGNRRWFRSTAPISLESHLSWFRGSYLGDDGREEYVVEREGRPLGVVSGQRVRDGRDAEVGYLFSGEARGHGYATEAVECLMRHLSEDRGVVDFAAEVADGNGPSMALLGRLGFARCGEGPDGLLVFRRTLAGAGSRP